VTTSELEVQRARRCLADFCRRRNTLPGVGRWRLNERDDGLVVDELESPDGRRSPVLRLRFEGGRWFLDVPAAGGWRPYPPRPEASSIEVVVNELEQAPLHVHWE
jgi:hypothetical protein